MVEPSQSQRNQDSIMACGGAVSYCTTRVPVWSGRLKMLRVLNEGADHPSFSPDLLTCDCQVFGPPMVALRDCRLGISVVWYNGNSPGRCFFFFRRGVM